MTQTLPAPGAAAAVRPESSLPRVLLVDDEPAVLDGLRRQLRRHFDLSTAPGGAEALQILQDAAEPDSPGRFAAVMSEPRWPRSTTVNHGQPRSDLSVPHQALPDRDRHQLPERGRHPAPPGPGRA
jgi:hypothetical protein